MTTENAVAVTEIAEVTEMGIVLDAAVGVADAVAETAVVVDAKHASHSFE